jgi:hypothetical protein
MSLPSTAWTRLTCAAAHPQGDTIGPADLEAMHFLR